MPKVFYGAQQKSATTPGEMSDAQYAALTGVKQTSPPLKLGAARPEFANKVMMVDGTVTDDLDAVRAGITSAQAADKAAFTAFKNDHVQEILDDTMDQATRIEYIAARQWALMDQLGEFEMHVAQGRFLIMVDANMTPRTYFQCAVPGNPDVELA